MDRRMVLVGVADVVVVDDDDDVVVDRSWVAIEWYIPFECLVGVVVVVVAIVADLEIGDLTDRRARTEDLRCPVLRSHFADAAAAAMKRI
jgi:hypothetical protein